MFEPDVHEYRTPFPGDAASGPGTYREVVYPPVWASTLLLGLLVLGVFAHMGLRESVACERPAELWIWDAAWLGSHALLLGIALFLGRLVIKLEAGALVVRFGFVSLGEARFSVTEIESLEPIAYRPIAQFGGWGWRVGRHAGEPTVVYSMRGRHGVLLRLRRPVRVFFRRASHVLIGSDRADELAAALTRVRS